jgi:ATP-dependent DNA ligase
VLDGEIVALDELGGPQFSVLQLLDHLDLGGRSPRVRARVPPCYPDAEPDELLRVARQHGLEGIVAKCQSFRSTSGKRSPDWIKTALLHTQEVIVGGWRTRLRAVRAAPLPRAGRHPPSPTTRCATCTCGSPRWLS